MSMNLMALMIALLDECLTHLHTLINDQVIPRVPAELAFTKVRPMGTTGVMAGMHGRYVILGEKADHPHRGPQKVVLPHIFILHSSSPQNAPNPLW